jgi:hypothetical protein
MPVILTTWEAEIQRIEVQDQSWQVESISKITKAKRAEGVAQAVEHWLCKCEALSSNSSTTKKTPKKLLRVMWY